MSLNLPPPASILSGILAELKNSIIPSVTDPRSLHMAYLSCYMLQVLIARENGLDKFIRSGIEDTYSLLPQSFGSSQPNQHDLLGSYAYASGLIEEEIEKNVVDKDWIGKAVAAEMNTIEAIDAAATKDPTIGIPSVPTHITPEMLNSYFSQVFPEKMLTAVRVRAVGVGNSKDTFLVELAESGEWGREIIIRRDVPFGTVDTSVVDEFPLVQALWKVGYLVAQPLWIEASPAALGAPFAIMQFIAGEVAGRTGLEGPEKLIFADGAASCGPQFAHALAKLHAIDLSGLGYSDELVALPTSDHIRNQIRRVRSYWKSRRLAPSATLAAGFNWLEANVPNNAARTSIIHGDPTPRNFMIHQGNVSALLDWETAHLGDPSEDLYFARMEMSQIMPWDDFLEEYYKAGGPPFATETIEFYQMWFLVRNAAWSSACLRGGVEERSLDIRWSYTGTYYYYSFLKQIAEFLSTH